MKLSEYAELPVMIVDDEVETLRSFQILLKSAGIRNVTTLDDSRVVMRELDQREHAAIILDLTMPYLPGADLLREITEHHPNIPVLIVTATSEIETAVECMKKGAFDYIVKPVEKERLLSSLRKALELSLLRREVSSLKESLLSERLRHEEAFNEIYTASPRIHALFRYVEAVATSQQPILITGETGVGKELFARAVHRLSGRKGRLVSVNIAGLDDHVFSDTLFGHRKGAFTGADQPREGLIAQAGEGTLFLDEIGDLDNASQVKLLRLLQEREYYPLGSDLPRQTDTRIIVSTNRDLPDLIKSGKFRRDLYYRLKAHQIEIPPLRERKEDIPILLEHFLTEAAESMHKPKPAYPPELLTLLSAYHFPGNVRELRSMVYDALATHRKGILSMERFREAIMKESTVTDRETPPGSLPRDDCLVSVFGRFPTLKEVEDFLIAEAMRLSKGNQGIAASLLGMTRQALNKRIVRARQQRG